MGIIGLISICSSIFYFNIIIFVISTIIVIVFVVLSSFSVNFEPMDYEAIKRMVAEIANTDKKELLLKQDLTKLSRLIEELDRIKKPEVISSVVNRFASNIEDESPDIRARAARVIGKVTPSMQRIGYSQAYVEVNKAFIEAEGVETNKRAYIDIADTLEKGIPWFVEKRLYDKPNEIISMFNDHSDNKEQEDRSKWAFKVLKKIANKNLVELLIEALRSENSVTQKEAYAFIKNISNSPVAAKFNKRVVKGLQSIDNEFSKNLKQELTVKKEKKKGAEYL